MNQRDGFFICAFLIAIPLATLVLRDCFTHETERIENNRDEQDWFRIGVRCGSYLDKDICESIIKSYFEQE